MRGRRVRRLAPIVVAFLVVGVAGDEVDVFVAVLQHHTFPGPEGRHRPAGTATQHKFKIMIHLPHGLGDLAGDLPVVLSTAMPQLPRPVHLVAQAPHPDMKWIGRTVGGPQLG